MKIIEPEYKIIYPASDDDWTKEIWSIATAARISHQSAEQGEANRAFIARLIRMGHVSVLEFGDMIVEITVDRAIANELTRHRHISCVQESTRYCNYGKGLTVIKPSNIKENSGAFNFWENAMLEAERYYQMIYQELKSAEVARSVLPLCTATNLVIKANFREWRHIFALRNSKYAHPDMRAIMQELERCCYHLLPEVFGVSG